MGLFDIFEGAFEIVKATGELAIGLGQVAVESTAELGEIMTDGFNEMVIKGNSDYKTSFEIKDEARRIESNAEHKFSVKKEEVENKIKFIKIKENELTTKRTQVLSLLRLSNKSNSLSPFYDIAVKNNLSGPYFDRKTFDLYSYIFNGPLFTGKRKECANDYLENAKDFKVEVDSKIAQMNIALSKLKDLEFQFEEESSVLDSLESLYKNLNSTNKNTIYGLIESIMKMNIVDCDVNINGEYTKKINEIKNICNNI